MTPHYAFANLIGGDWRTGGMSTHKTFNPARPNSVVGHYELADDAVLNETVSAARDAQAKWRRVPTAERIAIVNRFLDAVMACSEEIAVAITLEQGKPLAEARAETGKALAEARAMAGHVMRAAGDVMATARPGFRNLVTRRARGVIAAITPWNFPILTPMRKIAPALLYGNAVILKPSEFTPAAACLVGEVSRAILPAGVLQIVHGGADVGAGLVGKSGIDGITFTGSVATGKAIYRLAADILAELSLELGGKNAAIINDTHDLDGCLDQVSGAAFMCAGQRCTAISRVIVARELEAPVVEGLTARARTLVLGDGLADGTGMGPLINARQLTRVESLVEQGTGEGARIVTGGERATLQGLEDGYFFAPTILADVASDSVAAREEIFGPVISVMAYDSLDAAFEALNGVGYGLTSSLFSNDLAVVERFIEESESGMIHVNHGTIPDNHMPFGGIKNSGVGAYSVGPSAMNFYTTEHSVYVKH